MKRLCPKPLPVSESNDTLLGMSLGLGRWLWRSLLLLMTLLPPCLAGTVKHKDLSQTWGQWMMKWARLEEADQVENVNSHLNQMLSFADDRSLWQQQDYWSTPAETLRRGQGDCEDYAILKYFTLRQLGISADKLWLTFAKVRVGGPGSPLTLQHMVLAYYPAPGTDPLILDNLVGSLYPASMRPDLQVEWSFNAETLQIGQERYPARQLPQWRLLLARMTPIRGFTEPAKQ